jgi:hypothetical protein
MKQITDIHQLEMGKKYYLELYGTKITAYVTEAIEEEYPVFETATFAFPCLLSGEGYFRDIEITHLQELEGEICEYKKTYYKQMRYFTLKQVYSISDTHKLNTHFYIENEVYYYNTDDEDEIIDAYPELDYKHEIQIYEPTRDTIYEKFKQTSLKMVMDKYGFPELSTYVNDLL